MFERILDRRKVVLAGTLALLAGCTVVPKSTGPAPAPTPAPGPSSDVLPTDTARHRIALLVPLTGQNSNVGRSIANAATMALLDTNAQNLRVTNYDTSTGVDTAARRAIADGNTLFLGPLLSDNIPAVAAVARPAGVPIISFSNDSTAAARDVFIMGNLPGQSVERTARFALNKGITRFGALVPRGKYGQRASDALMDVTRRNGASVVAIEAFDRSNSSVASAARRLREKGGYEAVLIADGGRMSSPRRTDPQTVRIGRQYAHSRHRTVERRKGRQQYQRVVGCLVCGRGGQAIRPVFAKLQATVRRDAIPHRDAGL